MTLEPMPKAESPKAKAPEHGAAESPGANCTSTEAVALPARCFRLSQRELQRAVQHMAPDQELGFNPTHGCMPAIRQSWSERVTEVADSLSITTRDVDVSDFIPGSHFEVEEVDTWGANIGTINSALSEMQLIDWDDPEQFLTRDDIKIRLIKLRPTTETQNFLNLTDADTVLFQKPTTAVNDTIGSQTDKARQRQIVATLDTEVKQPEILDIRSLSRPPRILAYTGVDLLPLREHISELVGQEGNFILGFEDMLTLSRIDGEYKILHNFKFHDATPAAFIKLVDSLQLDCYTYLPEERPSAAELMGDLRIALRDEGTYYLKSARTSGGQGILRITHSTGDLAIETESADAVKILTNLYDSYSSSIDVWSEPCLRESVKRLRDDFQDPALYILAWYIERMDCPIIEREVPGERVFQQGERAEFRLIFQNGGLAGMYTKVSPSDIAANISIAGRGVAVSTVVDDIIARRLSGQSPEEIQSATRHALERLQHESTKLAHQLIEHFKTEDLELDDFAIDVIPVWNAEMRALDLYFLEIQFGYEYSGLTSVNFDAAHDVWTYKCITALRERNFDLFKKLSANPPSTS